MHQNEYLWSKGLTCQGKYWFLLDENPAEPANIDWFCSVQIKMNSILYPSMLNDLFISHLTEIWEPNLFRINFDFETGYLH